jgi:thioesterase-3
MMSSIHAYPLTIIERHLDTLGHVNNATYLEIFEEARWDFVAKQGFGIAEIQEKKIGPVILEVHVRFIKELLLRTEIQVKTRFSQIDQKISTIHQWIENENEVRFCEAEFKMGLFNLSTRKLILPTSQWLAILSL